MICYCFCFRFLWKWELQSDSLHGSSGSLLLRSCTSVFFCLFSLRNVEAGTHLPTPEGWKAELAFWVAGWLHTEINIRYRELNPDMVAHLSTNRARHRLTSLIEANALTTMPDH